MHGRPKGDVARYHIPDLKARATPYFLDFCKSLLCSMFNEQTCTWFTRLFVWCSSPCPEYLIKPYNAIFLKSPGSKDINTDIPNCQIHKYINTNSQIHEYSLWRSARNTQHMLYFWTAGGSRMSKMIFPSDPIRDPRSKSLLVDFRLLHCPPRFI